MARQRFEPARGTRGTAGYEYYELSLAQGPVAIGVTSQNRLIDFIGTAWLLLVDLDMQLHLFRQTATVGQWEEVTEALPPVFDAPLPTGARRVSFAFDQSARATLAYELDGETRVTRWDTTVDAYASVAPFDGVDPFVVFDATWAYAIDESDVLLFYLSLDRQRVMCRVQRDNYGVEYELHDYAQPVVLDRVVRLGWKYQVLVSDAAGDPRTLGVDLAALRSLLYPVRVSDTLTPTVGAPDGEYIFSMLTRSESEAALTMTVVTGVGTYVPASFDAEAQEPPLILAAALGAGSYDLVVMDYDSEEAPLALSAALNDGKYLFSLISHEQNESALDFTVSAPEGSYELGD